MAGIKRLQAVPVVFLWIALCFPGPSAAATAAGAPTRDAAFSVVLSAPACPGTQLVRVKADKPVTFSSGCLPAPLASSLQRPVESLTSSVSRATDPPSVLLTCPPLSARPPPAA